ncbi:hypothetical protein N7G274_007154 [Stereocaulon virgatum]|uniref:BTB domain-containing protein n=1 Tax=Stereocaulon virgatum TaxID=373712 RepID=A0ABR4A5R1_9LECA
MFLTGSQRANSRRKPEVALTLNHSNSFGGPLGETSTPSQLQIFTKRYKLSTITRDPLSIIQNPPPGHIPPLSNRSYESGFSKHRPKHVPIVIPPAIIDCVLKDLPPSSKYAEPVSPPIPRASFRLTYDFEKEEIPVVTNSPPRPRHIPILIPAFAQPFGTFPPTPPSSGGSTPRASQTAPHSCKSLFTEMSRPTTSGSHTSTLDSNTPATSPNQIYAGRFNPSSSTYLADMNSSSETSHQDKFPHDVQSTADTESTGRPPRSVETTAPLEPSNGHNTTPPSTNGTTNLSGLVCNVHKCTGKEPHALVGATTTILGDKLYVFGGRVLSRRRPQLTSDLYELDLVRRHWTKIETTGDIPPPRYFHSVCALGDTKLICYGGMSPAPNPAHGSGSQGQLPQTADQPDTIVMSDIHIYDAQKRRWTHVATSNTPQGRYAHCAAVLLSSAIFTSANAPLSAIHHNPPSSIPNQGTLGVALDGTGGAEMVVVGGQDSANHYIEQISVFNLRSLKWTDTKSLGRSCGAYRSVVAPLTSLPASKIGRGSEQPDEIEGTTRRSDRSDSESSMLIYSNYNFLDVKLELQVRIADGSLVEKPMTGQFSPPGLRFPNGGVLDNHFVVSGTYLTSSRQEYALWALDLKNLTWSRIDAGGGVFSQGSWNRGILWPRRNTFVILGNRKRSLVEDYNHRRINFSNICMVELEAFGLYDNPRQAWPTSNYPSISAPVLPPSVTLKTSAPVGRPLPSAAIDLGLMAMTLRDLADMDLIAIGGERIPVNSYLLSRRWGPFFVHLLRESTITTSQNDASSSSDGGTLRPAHTNQTMTSRNSSITITPSITTATSTTPSSLTATSSQSNNTLSSNRSLDPPTPNTLAPSSRPRQLYLPHTILTIRALVHYLYTSSLPSPPHNLCTPQILCSLLQLARPYRVDGLLEATVERLHQILDGRNAAALFNAAAMAAGGGRGTGVAFSKEDEQDIIDDFALATVTTTRSPEGRQRKRLRDNTESSDETGSEISGSEISSSAASESEDENSTQRGASARGTALGADEIWSGGVSCVVGLQKRGLRGLMEGRRARERGQGLGRTGGGVTATNGIGHGVPHSNSHTNGNGVGLGIA